MGNQIYKEISKFAKMQRDEIKREKVKKERKSVYHHRVSEFMDNYSSMILTWQMETEVEVDGNA